ncbi:hypothetical protein [Streptomyces piniterrae]|nr:hypothetical protein [Streptomyces piniterrae]
MACIDKLVRELADRIGSRTEKELGTFAARDGVTRALMLNNEW